MDLSNDVLIDANALRNSTIQKKQIREYTFELLSRINDELKSAHRDGLKAIITELPIIFNITNMSEKSARREIWCKIIECLKSKNYRVNINPQEDTCLLKITWISKEDEGEITHQNNVINMHTKHF